MTDTITRCLGTLLVFIILALCPAHAEDYRTPLAGDAFHTELFGKAVDVEARDRSHVTAANFGVQWIPYGPSFYQVLPFGALYVWRNKDDGHERFRGTFSGVVNDINYNIGPRALKGWEFVLTFDNTIIPLGRSEYVEGQRIRDVEVAWSYFFAGVGIGYRHLISPWHQDNALEATLTYEPGYRWFDRTSGTAPNFIVPSDTYEGRIHFRLRMDALDRNLMELPHRGFALGGDIISAHRSHWEPWGGVAFPTPNVQKEKDYMAFSGYAIAAGQVPFVDSDRHRLISSLYGGIGTHLDRFSAFRLPGRPTGYEWEALSLPTLPGVAFNELFPTHYGIADLTYRYEALFFLFPYIRGTWATVERPRFAPDGTIVFRTDAIPALGAGVVSGGPWKSQVELNYSYNFGIFRDPTGTPTMGGHGMFVMWSRLL